MKSFLCSIVIALALGFSQSVTAIETESPRQEITLNEPTVVARHGVVEISCPADGKTYTFYVYSITGQLVKRIQLCDSTASFEFAKGCYIIKCEAWIKKLLIS